MPLGHRDYSGLLRTALSQDDVLGGLISGNLFTLRELRMMRFMNAVTDKPDWTEKVFDKVIIEKWKSETMVTPFKDFTENMFAFCIDELQHKTKAYKQSGLVTVFDADVVKSDNVVSEKLRQALIDAVKSLEDIPERLKDWHPGSDGKVLNLVHPSLFPFVYAKTRILPEGETVGLHDCIIRSGEGQDSTEPGYANDRYSENFQWLPCEVKFSGEQIKITSYINNLHPERNQDLYKVIEDYIRCSIPLWDQALTPLLSHGTKWLPRIPYEKIEYDRDYDGQEEPSQLSDESDDVYWDRVEQWQDANIEVKQPEPTLFSDRFMKIASHIKQPFYLSGTNDLKPEWIMDLASENADRGLQIIVKLANIELTPEKPSYGGGSWHVEGALNERIVATSLYYYSSTNITTSALSFRQSSDTDHIQDIGYEQDRHQFLPQVFGLHNSENAMQTLGSVETSQGRLLAFPNTLQHRVEPFSLADKSKPGHRKILALFLVDPNCRVISTKDVPCQRADWWGETVVKYKVGRLTKLPNEIFDRVFRHMNKSTFSMDEAKEFRGRLMEERTRFSNHVNHNLESLRFNLCEH